MKALVQACRLVLFALTTGSVFAADTGTPAGTDPGAWNFDDVTAPALPAGWNSTVDGDGTPWITQTVHADSAPNGAYAAEHESSAEASLVSPAVTGFAAGTKLRFRHRFNLENEYDGGVLEIAIADGAFVDIVAAGGSFLEAGYNGTLTDDSNPLGTRDAWNGEQETFVTTTVQLPAAAANQPLRLRWRLGSDSSTAATAPNGWWLDSIVLIDDALPNEPSIVIAPQSLTVTVAQGAQTSANLSVANAGVRPLTYDIPGVAGSPAIGGPYVAPDLPTATGPAHRFSTGRGVAAGLRGGAVALDGNGSISVAQMNDNTVTAPNSVSCGSGGVTDQTSWWRRFYFAEHTRVGAAAVVKTVTIATELGPDIPATINVYTTPHGNAASEQSIPLNALTLIGTGTATVGGALRTFEIPVNAAIDDTVGKDLVVEYRIDGSPTQFLPGGNATPQTHPTYLSAPACGAFDPVPSNEIGFPNFHLIMVVNLGATTLPVQCTNAAALPWLGATPRTGVVGMNASTDVALSIDAADLEPGLLQSTMCLTTNDAAHPVVEVPLSVTVIGSGDAIFVDGFEND